MSFFSRFTRKSGKSDDALYAQVWREIESKNVDEGLWARLWAENKGHEEKTKAAYLNERVKQLQESARPEETASPASTPSTGQSSTPSGPPPEVVTQGQNNSQDFARKEVAEQSVITPEINTKSIEGAESVNTSIDPLRAGAIESADQPLNENEEGTENLQVAAGDPNSYRLIEDEDGEEEKKLYHAPRSILMRFVRGVGLSLLYLIALVLWWVGTLESRAFFTANLAQEFDGSSVIAVLIAEKIIGVIAGVLVACLLYLFKSVNKIYLAVPMVFSLFFELREKATTAVHTGFHRLPHASEYWKQRLQMSDAMYLSSEAYIISLIGSLIFVGLFVWMFRSDFKRWNKLSF